MTTAKYDFDSLEAAGPRDKFFASLLALVPGGLSQAERRAAAENVREDAFARETLAWAVLAAFRPALSLRTLRFDRAALADTLAALAESYLNDPAENEGAGAAADRLLVRQSKELE